MPTIKVKSALYALFGLFIAYLVYRAVSTVSDYVEQYQTLQRDNETLTDRVNRSNEALKMSETSNAALLAEHSRIKKFEAEHQLREIQLNQQLKKEKEENQNEIKRLEAAIRRAGVTDVAVPDDVIRMQREQAKSVNRRANERYGRQ